MPADQEQEIERLRAQNEALRLALLMWRKWWEDRLGDPELIAPVLTTDTLLYGFNAEDWAAEVPSA